MLNGPFLFPDINPVIFSVGIFSLRWYGVAYLIGLLGGAFILKSYRQYVYPPFGRDFLDSLLVPIFLGIILGGRLGYVVFYNPLFYVQNPLAILAIWQGGMSFHGGFLGVIIAILLKTPKALIKPLADLFAIAAPLGLFCGRISNFINAELWGRPTDLPWGVIFPHPDDLPRHPSQLYEAFLEGIMLFIIIFIALRVFRLGKLFPGLTAGIFCVTYTLFRFLVEFTRSPDQHIGLLFGYVTLGQLLSIPFFILGLWLIIEALRHKTIN